jgi:hypothetical protein
MLNRLLNRQSIRSNKEEIICIQNAISKPRTNVRGFFIYVKKYKERPTQSADLENETKNKGSMREEGERKVVM